MSIDEVEFQRRAMLAFPELYSGLTQSTGLVHIEMAALEQFANAAIRNGEFDQLTRCYDFIQSLAAARSELHPDVLNAIHVSFLEGLDFDHRVNGARAKAELPPILRLMWEDQMEHDRKLGL